MRILHVSGSDGWGGNEQQVMDMIPELKKLGVENMLFGVDKSVLQKKCQETGVPFYIAKTVKLNKFPNYKYLKQLVEEVKPDLIHLHTSDSITVFTLSGMLFNLKTKAVFSKKGLGRSSSFLSKYKYNYKNVLKVICVSNAVKVGFTQTMYAKNQDRLVVVYDGVNLDRTVSSPMGDIRELFNIDKDKYVIGNIANHANAKDLPTLMKMMNHLVNVLGIKNVHLLQIGDHSDKITPGLKQQIIDFKLSEYITLVGFQQNAPDLLEQMDVYVMSSEREGLPITVFEAFLKKTPVVSTKAGGIPEAIEHGYNGYLSEVGDFEDLAKNMANLLGDKENQVLFAERSNKIFYERFTAQIVAKNTLAVYKEVLEKI